GRGRGLQLLRIRGHQRCARARPRMRDPVAITGAGAVTSRDVSLDALPEAVRARAARAERVTQLVLAAAGRALMAAGLDATDGEPRPRLGVVLGTAFGCFLTNAAYERRLLGGGPAAASPRLFAATVSNAAAGELAIAYRLGGPSVTLTAGAASGLVALGHAADLVRAGDADAVVAGGADALDDDLRRWLAAGGLDCGRAPAEGAALVVLEHADRARGRAVLGTVEGVGAGFEPDPAGEGAGAGIAAAVATALEGGAGPPGGGSGARGGGSPSPARAGGAGGGGGSGPPRAGRGVGGRPPRARGGPRRGGGPASSPSCARCTAARRTSWSTTPP